MVSAGPLTTLWLWAAAACGSIDLPPGVGCGSGGECPRGTTCGGDGVCWAGMPPVDANANVRIEAEAYDAVESLDGIYDWVTESSIPGASGSYITAMPNTGGYCPGAPPTTCGAHLSYRFTVAEPGIYYVHVRSVAAEIVDDSIHYGLDGVWVAAPGLPVTGYFEWSTVLSGTLNVADRAEHVLDVWMREDGARLDVLVLSTSQARPE